MVLVVVEVEAEPSVGQGRAGEVVEASAGLCRNSTGLCVVFSSGFGVVVEVVVEVLVVVVEDFSVILVLGAAVVDVVLVVVELDDDDDVEFVAFSTSEMGFNSKFGSTLSSTSL